MGLRPEDGRARVADRAAWIASSIARRGSHGLRSLEIGSGWINSIDSHAHPPSVRSSEAHRSRLIRWATRGARIETTQEIRSSPEDLRPVRSALYVAQEMGTCVGGGSLLLGPVSAGTSDRKGDDSRGLSRSADHRWGASQRSNGSARPDCDSDGLVLHLARLDISKVLRRERPDDR